MYFDLFDLADKLKKHYNIHTFNLKHIGINGLKLIPNTFNSDNAPLIPDILYICRYRTYKNLPMQVNLPPMLVVMDNDTILDRSFFPNRTAIIVDGCEVSTLLVTIAGIMHTYGQNSSQLEDFSRRLLKCGSFQAQLEESCNIMGNPIIVADRNQRVVGLWSQNVSAKQWLSDIQEEGYVIAAYSCIETNMKVQDESYGSNWPVLKPGESGRPAVLRKTLAFEKRTVGYLYVFGTERNIEKNDIYSAELIGNFILRRMLESETQETISPENIVSLLTGIIDGRIDSTSFINRLQRETNLITKTRMYIIMIESYDVGPMQRSMFDVMNTISQKITGSYGMLYDNSIVILLNQDNEVTNFHDLLDGVSNLIKDNNLYAGISNVFSGLEKLRPYYFQARKALYFGKTYNGRGFFYCYKDCVPYHVIELISEFDDLTSFCSPGLMRLIRYDRQTNSALTETLRIYLGCDKNKAQTARALYLHLNTVKYRLYKIEEILQEDLSNQNTILLLLMSFKILEYLGEGITA